VEAYFFDSSALVKRYTIETGTPWVESTISQNPIYLAHIIIYRYFQTAGGVLKKTTPSQGLEPTPNSMSHSLTLAPITSG
jgi:hypothetical protein